MPNVAEAQRHPVARIDQRTILTKKALEIKLKPFEQSPKIVRREEDEAGFASAAVGASLAGESQAAIVERTIHI
jgi:hypothetical protein